MAEIPYPSTAVPSPSKSFQRIRPTHASNSERIGRISPHDKAPTSQSQSQNSLKTLGMVNPGAVSDSGGDVGNCYEESRNTFGLMNSGVEHCEAEKIINTDHVAAKESAEIAAPGSGNGKKKVMRKTVILVKKVIKKRVPKRLLASCSEKAVKAEDVVNFNEVRHNLNLANDVIGNDGVDKSRVVHDENDAVKMTVDATESSNLNEKSDMVVMKKPNITQELESRYARHDSEPSGIACTELDRSKLYFIENTSKEMVPVSGTNTRETNNIESNDVESEAGGNNLTISETSMETKEIENSKTGNSLEDFIMETAKIDAINEVDVELLSGQNAGSLRENGEKTIGKTKGLLLSGKQEAVDLKKKAKREIFIGGLDRAAQEDDIRKVFAEAGVIAEIRLMMSNCGKNRGYGFVQFATVADAKNALAKYSNVEIRGKKCNIAPVESNDTIFLGNINKNWKTKDVMKVLKKAGIGKIDKVTLKADPDNIERNRGFAFVEFQSCKDAQIAFNKFQKKDIFWDKEIVKASWAQPLSEPADEEILHVKSVYAEHLPSSWDNEKVKDYFKRFGEIESVALSRDLFSSRRKDFAFINYMTRDAALTCIEAFKRERLDDGSSEVKIAVSLAKSVPKKKQTKQTSDLSHKQLFDAKQKTTSKKQHEPRYLGNVGRSSYDHVKVDERSSTTDELVQILRQQASNKHILSHPVADIDIPGHHFPLPGSKRTFSLSGHDPLYLERQNISRQRVENSHPLSVPSSSSLGVGMSSFPYQYQLAPSFSSEYNERNTYPSRFQTRAEAPYYADHNLQFRCE